MTSFLNENFLLTTETARNLYHKYAKDEPIIDYHCHVSPKEIYEDKRFTNLTEIWLGGDHYKWRLMRSNGVDEYYITGDADPYEKFLKFAELMPKAIGNPMYHWCHLELKKYFGYEGVLNGDTAKEVWDLCNSKLATEEMSARGIIRQSNVAFIGTTDDPVDTLEYHKLLAADESIHTVVAPSFRPDKALNIDKAGWREYIARLAQVSETEISDLDSLKRALSVRIEYFAENGCRASDKYIENYKQCIRNLAKFGVKVICYNFMPIFDWTRSNLFHPVGDGSTALFYEKNMIQDDYNAMAKYILDFTEKYNMSFPGWEPERMAKLDELFKAYEGVDHEKLWANLKYFLEAIMPTCRECDIKMAIHMDDPPWDIFGLPRLLINEENIDRFLKMVDDPYNCLTLCSGSLNADPNNNVAEIVRKHCDRIAFAHIRNVKHFENGDFSEASHRDCDGDTGILDILKAYHDCGFEGYIRPDHGRHLWDEGPGSVRPGYGLYDRALGIMYMLGVWDSLEKFDKK